MKKRVIKKQRVSEICGKISNSLKMRRKGKWGVIADEIIVKNTLKLMKDPSHLVNPSRINKENHILVNS